MKAPDITLENATPDDLPAIIAIMAEGQVPTPRDGWSEASAPLYRAAFDEMLADSRIEFFVARSASGNGVAVGYIVMEFSRTLSGFGMRRATLHSVFVAASMRGKQIGGLMVAEAEKRARARGAARLDLASDKRRLDAHRFYRTLGYAQSHEGFSKSL